MQSSRTDYLNDGLLYIKNGVRYRPFLSFTALRIFGLLIFGFTQFILVYFIFSLTTLIPIDQLNQEDANSLLDIIYGIIDGGSLSSTIKEFKEYLAYWPAVKGIYSLSRLVPPILILGLFARLIQKPQEVKKAFTQYFIMTALLFVAELIFYYFFFQEIFKEILIQENVDEKIIILSTMFLQEFMMFYANLNIFIDMLIAVIFFKFFMCNPKTTFFKNHIRIYRSLSILPVLYILVSGMLVGFEKLMYVSLPVWLISLFSNRGIYFFLIFACMCIYFKIRFKEKNENYISHLKNNSETLYFTVFICLVLLGITVVSKLFAFDTRMAIFKLDYAYNYYLLIPFVLVYNYSIKPRMRFAVILYAIYYIFIFFILFVFYSAILYFVIDIFVALSKSIV